jgi:hypothetical protein
MLGWIRKRTDIITEEPLQQRSQIISCDRVIRRNILQLI